MWAFSSSISSSTHNSNPLLIVFTFLYIDMFIEIPYFNIFITLSYYDLKAVEVVVFVLKVGLVFFLRFAFVICV